MTTPERTPAVTKAVLGIATGLVVAGVGWLDFTTGAEVSLALFYLIPIAVAGLRLGYGSAVSTAVLASAAWFAADFAFRGIDDLYVTLWNASTRLVLFAFVGVMLARLQKDRGRLASLTEQLDRSLSAERVIARTDPLTGLRNQRGFIEALERELARSRRENSPFTVVYLDLDNFKQVNDTQGHAAGDKLLRQVGEVIGQVSRVADVPARLGGDEFAVFCWNVESAAAENLARRLFDAVTRVCAEVRSTQVSVSVGIASFSQPPATVSEALAAADAAMYDAKQAGKAMLKLRVYRAETQAPID